MVSSIHNGCDRVHEQLLSLWENSTISVNAGNGKSRFHPSLTEEDYRVEIKALKAKVNYRA